MIIQVLSKVVHLSVSYRQPTYRNTALDCDQSGADLSQLHAGQHLDHAYPGIVDKLKFR